jgi:hypothetical protein
MVQSVALQPLGLHLMSLYLLVLQTIEWLKAQGIGKRQVKHKLRDRPAGFT